MLEMKKHKKVSLVILTLTIFLSAGCNNLDSRNEIKKEIVVKSEKVVEAQYMQFLIDNINAARFNINLGNRQVATNYINDALSLLDLIDLVMPKDYKESKVASGKLTYRLNGRASEYHVPIYSGSFIYDNFAQDKKMLPNQNLYLHSVELAYVKIIYDRKFINAKLVDAKINAMTNRLPYAELDLKSLIDNIVIVDTSYKLPINESIGNLIISSELLKNRNFHNSLKLIKHAEESIEKLNFKDKSSSSKLLYYISSIKNLLTKKKVKMNEINNAISKIGECINILNKEVSE
jgi:hypothetical protein